MSADRKSLDDILADEAHDREELLRQLSKANVHPGRYQVVRQFCTGGALVEQVVSSHRWEWVAELRARRRTRRDVSHGGAYYVARRAGS